MGLTPSFKKREIVLVTVLMALGTAMRLAWFNGLYGHDDWTYLYYVRSFLNGQTREMFQSVNGLRLLFWFPIAACFQLFGVSYAAAFLPSFICGLATVPLTYACVRKLGGSALTAVMGVLILLFNPIDWIVSTTLRGDIEMSFYGGLLLLLLLHFRELRGTRQLIAGAALGFVWGLAAVTKEWGFVFAWGFFAVALFDAATSRRIPWEFCLIGIGFLALLGIDAIVLHALTGEWLGRFKTSLDWYQQLGHQPKNLGDRSTRFLYLPDILLGLRNQTTEANRFANGYPYFGIYMWLLLGALPLGLCLRGTLRPVAWFITSILLWIEFGSMSWTVYLPYHKEPRYLALLSVPVAVLIAATGTRLWRTRSRGLQGGLVAAGLLVAVLTVGVVRDEHWEYTHRRDFMPAFMTWLEAHPGVRIWTVGTIQNEIDLRFGYKFSDPVHEQAGAPGHGSAMDLMFWHKARQAGDYLLVNRSWVPLRNEYPALRPMYFESTPAAVFRGPFSSAALYRVKPEEPGRKRTDYLSDREPALIEQSFAELHFDYNVSGLPLTLGGIRYDKGLGTHANSRVTYRLDGKFTLFSAVIGVDDTENGGGSVYFEVRRDNELVYKSKLMHSRTPPEKIAIDLTGAKILQLSVTDAGDGINGDHGDWADAKLIEVP